MGTFLDMYRPCMKWWRERCYSWNVEAAQKRSLCNQDIDQPALRLP